MKYITDFSMAGVKSAVKGGAAVIAFTLMSFGAGANQITPSSGFPELQTPSYVTTLFTHKTLFIESDEDVFDFVIFIGEIKGIDSNGVQNVQFSVPIGKYFTVDYDNTVQYMNGRNVSNDEWQYSTDGESHIFTYIGNNGVFPGGGYSFIGVNARFVRPDREEVLLEVNLAPDSGGQVDSPRDYDSDYIYY
ncbi:hypothetical protein L2750_03295 [Shewanella submarina]|uniref:Uncharacterized protein n=1 Tax=Shewanella submarina TaxID=2016376 RepID=A0ABV7GK05_9GAMM|nr:hypothetical protein [Shewanella submarina]MCL1036182.1 hypothetical protein [Shewanella submarina]